MNNNTTIFTLIQNFLSEAELRAILSELNYTETARKCTVSTLISYLIGAATNEWKSLRHAADVDPSTGLVSVDHSSLSKHLKALNYGIIKRIFEIIVGKLNRAACRRIKLPKKQLLSIDSTTITVGKSRLPWALYHGERSGIKLHVNLYSWNSPKTNDKATSYCSIYRSRRQRNPRRDKFNGYYS